jgi:hypothetical protein
LEEIIGDLTGDRPENQTAVDMPPEERAALHDGIKALTGTDPEPEIEEGRQHYVYVVPQEVLDGYGIVREVSLVSEYLGEGESREGHRQSHEIYTSRNITNAYYEERVVSFRRQPGEPDVSVVEEMGRVESRYAGVETKPLTLAELRLIGAVITDLLRGTQ